MLDTLQFQDEELNLLEVGRQEIINSITLEDVKNNEEVKQLIIGAQQQLDALGYTEHSTRHITIVSSRAGEILKTLGYDEKKVELAKIAGYLHDIGNVINRVDHAHSD